MKITNIKTTEGKLPEAVLNKLAKTLIMQLNQAGFITEVNVKNSSRIDLGMHMKSFIIDTNVHGYNTRHNPYHAGKRTSTPSWKQRVTYNDIVNETLTSFGVSATVVSGCFKVRQGFEALTESDWYDQIPSWMSHNEANGHYVEEGYDAEYYKQLRKERAKERRLALKQPAKVTLRVVS